MKGFAGTLVGLVMARMVRLVDLQKSYYVALYFACAVLLQQLVLQGLLLLLTQRPGASILDLRCASRSPARPARYWSPARHLGESFAAGAPAAARRSSRSEARWTPRNACACWCSARGS